MAQNKTLIGLPTYNEVKNIRILVERILALNIDVDILIVDDNSSDGTRDIVNQLSQEDLRIKTIHRENKMGVGSAHLNIINYAYNHNYQTLITMDSDFSHAPEDIENFIKKSGGYDVVIGNRFKNKDALDDWNIFRKAITNIGHFLTKNLLRLPYDASGGFRLYNLKTIPRSYFDVIDTADYEFFFTSLALLHRLGCKILEIPIILKKRVYGSSKMSLGHMVKGLFHLFYLSININRTILKIQKYDCISAVKPEVEWDAYWSKEKSKRFYDIIASFYRFKLIKPNLDRFIQKNFSQGMDLLHAGCGSGETDTDVANYANLTALDLSPIAIDRYKSIHKDKCQTIVGNIFNISVPLSSFDGIYNLGVMEHFLENQIIKILEEFNRVLKPNGKIILFWPPSYGLSVLALRFIHFILNDVLRKNIKLHPDEPTRLHSKKQIIALLSKTGFRLEEFSFSIKDAFTYVVVVATKVGDKTLIPKELSA